MKTHVKSCALALFMAALALTAAAAGPPLIIVNGIDLMPQGRASDGRGIMTDAVMEALKRAGLTGQLQFPPWRRAQKETMNGKDILITALSRTPEREDKYTWIFPVFKYERSFVTLKQRYDSFETAKSLIKQVAVTGGSAQYDILAREGFSPAQLQIIPLERQRIIPTLLLNGRVDAWFAVTAEAKFALKNLAEASRFVVGPPVGDFTLQYVACSKDCSPELVAKLKKAGKQMEAEGTLDAIIRRYQ